MRAAVFLSCFILILLGTALTDASAAEAKFVFGVKPGTIVQSSYAAVDLGRFQPFVGFDLAALSVDTEEGDASGTIVVPHLGLRVWLREDRPSGVVAPYLQGDLLFTKAFLEVDDVDPEEEELAEDILGLWGLSIAFGAEYFLSDAFSVGGEYGLRYFRDSVEEHRASPDYPGDPGDKLNDEFSVVFKITYTAISLNYRF